MTDVINDDHRELAQVDQCMMLPGGKGKSALSCYQAPEYFMMPLCFDRVSADLYFHVKLRACAKQGRDRESPLSPGWPPPHLLRRAGAHHPVHAIALVAGALHAMEAVLQLLLLLGLHAGRQAHAALRRLG